MKRLIITFSGRCALNCTFCYAPFNGVKPTEHRMKDILNFAKIERFDILTFGGGDPLQYSFTRNALQEARQSNFFVHLDTHGVSICEDDYEIFRSSVGLLGLPLDGPEAIHDKIRGRVGHFQKVVSVIKKAASIDIPIKINTMASRQNVDFLEQLACLLESTSPLIWSIYQFMDLPDQMEVNKSHSIPSADFLDITSTLINRHPKLKIEVGASGLRKSDYLFVRTDGMLLTHTPKEPGYLELGTVDSSNWRANYELINKSMLPIISKSRYASTINP